MQFWKLSPSGNPTILLPAEQIAPADRADAAAAVLSPEHLGADQVGFYSLPGQGRLAHLEMMGGEFCLNATRCLAFLLTHLDYLDCGGRVEKLSVSGLKEPALCKVVGDQAWTALDFPRPPEPLPLEPNVWLLRLPGICHVVHLQSKPPENSTAYCQAALTAWGLTREDAVGFLWLDEDKPEVTPLVWVRRTASLVRESACGSGSLACALLLRHRLGMTNLNLLQPSGRNLSITIEQSGHGLRVWVGGPVKLIAMGELFI